MKFENPNVALRYLSSHSNTLVDGKIVKVQGIKGLSCCSAIDYLSNYSSYNVVIVNSSKN